jgi:hypothetical protein
MTDREWRERFPEHVKLRKVSEFSQAIGEFLDVGLGQQGLALYERATFACECQHCSHGVGARSPWHSEEEKQTLVEGVVQESHWQPVSRPIQDILAAYFNIDRAKIDVEKADMLEMVRREQAHA